MKKYFIKTFGCSMNQADSEKINMILLQSGFMKALNWQDADLVIFNTCSVRQKGEDRVFGIMTEIDKYNKESEKDIKVGITGCMVRRTGIGEKYLDSYKRNRHNAKKINILKNKSEILNNDDKLFPRGGGKLDFVLRIEDISYLPHILTEIYNQKIGSDDKFDDYLKQAQQRENPYSATIIIQTGCDNFCNFCIVPYTRGSENSRPIQDIVREAKQAVENGAKEITLVGQNVNSYGKQFVDKKLWNKEKGKWNPKKNHIGIDIDDSLVHVFEPAILDRYNQKYKKNLQFKEIITHDFLGDSNLKKEFFDYFEEHWKNQKLYPGARETLIGLKKSGHTLSIITSRPSHHKSRTIEFLENIFGDNFFENYLFTSDYQLDDKSILVEKYGIDIVVEDAPHHIKSYINNTTANIIVFSQPWNQHVLPSKQVKKIDSWEEILEIIKRLSFSPFRKLLEELNTIEGLDRIRFTSSNPHDMTQDILDAHFELEKTCNYLHFALQSGNNKMLRRMNRKHSYEDFKNIVTYLREKDPDFSISTDIIVGYSGETEEMFEDTIRAFKELEFDFAYNARYSVRPGTIAAKMFPDDVSDKVKAERWHILNDKLLESILKRNTRMLGNIEEVLIAGKKDEYYFGRTRNFKEIYFLVSEERVVKIGDLVQVRLDELDRYIIKGSLI